MKAVFVPRTVEFVKKRALEIQRANPLLTRVRAIETSSVALGYSSWFDAQSRINAATLRPTEFDEDVEPEVRLWRRWQQGCALVDIGGFTPCEADLFVRFWHPTGRNPFLRPDEYRSAFQRALLDIEDFESASKDAQEAWPGEASIRVNEHLIRWAGQNHSSFVLSDEMLAKVPPHVRGNSSAWLDFEGGLALAWVFPEWFSKDAIKAADAYFLDFQPRVYQWHYGVEGRSSCDSRTLSELRVEAATHPLDMFPLSYRYPRIEHGDSQTMSVPMLSGAAFAKMIADRGALRLQDVRWFDVDGKALGKLAMDRLSRDLDGPMPIDQAKLKSLGIESRPGWLSPFKHGPMFEVEYNMGAEGGEMMLHEELNPDEWNNDDGDGGDPHDDEPHDGGRAAGVVGEVTLY